VYFLVAAAAVHVIGQLHTRQRKASALMLAVAKGHTDCARLLLNAGADKEATNSVRFGRRVCGCANVFWLGRILCRRGGVHCEWSNLIIVALVQNLLLKSTMWR
jgi:hypothetical protein